MSCGLVNTFQWLIAHRRSAEADPCRRSFTGKPKDRWQMQRLVFNVCFMLLLLNQTPVASNLVLLHFAVWSKIGLLRFLQRQQKRGGKSDKAKTAKLLHTLAGAPLPVWEPLVMLRPDLRRERWSEGWRKRGENGRDRRIDRNILFL